MPNIYFIGDTHFFHKNIINYCQRPFKTVEQMNDFIVNRWNSVVSKHDIVYVVGDFALCGKDRIIEITKRLNGRKRLVLGNHDGASVSTYFEAGFERVYDHPIIIDDFFIVSHEPCTLITEKSLYANIYAHVHNSSAYKDASPRTFCVSAERKTMQYTPISFDEIKNTMLELEQETENG